jgi:hypothetical protein
MQICPQSRAANVPGCLKQMMVIVPVDTDVNEAQNITQEHRNQWPQSREPGVMRRLHVEHHDRDEDR